MSNKVMILILVVFVVLVGTMGAGFFFMWTQLNAVNAQASANTEASGEDPEQTDRIGPILPLETFIVNLADEGGNRYLRVTMKLELENEKHMEAVQQRLPMIRNSILMILPSKKYEDIDDVEGKIGLRDEVIAKLNSFLKPAAVTSIYFTEFVIQ